jgi:hypothetical protein
MKNDMKLILERWDRYRLDEIDSVVQQIRQVFSQGKQIVDQAKQKIDVDLGPAEINTYGDLKKVLQAIELKRTGKLAAEKVTEYLKGLLPPGASTVYNMIKDAKDTFDFVKNMYSADDSFKTQSGLDRLNVDDNVSKIVDDNVEAAFMKHLVTALGRMKDETPIGDWNATQELERYLAQQFEGHAVKK